MYRQPNAEQVVIHVNIIPIVPLPQSLVLTVVLLITLAISVQAASLNLLQTIMIMNFGAVTPVVITTDVWHELVMIAIIIQDIQDVLIPADELYF